MKKYVCYEIRSLFSVSEDFIKVSTCCIKTVLFIYKKKVYHFEN